MADYSQDSDLQVYEPNILNEGVAAFTAYHALAADDINRILRAEWWPRARDQWLASYPYDMTIKLMGDEADFDPQYLTSPDQLKAASCFRVFGWYAYEQLAKYSDAEPDRYEKKKEVYVERFREEMVIVLGAGLEYDFSRDGQVTMDERHVTAQPRRTRRC